VQRRNQKQHDDRARRLEERAGSRCIEDVERTHRHVAREGFSSVMNDTKWEEVVSAIMSLPGGTPRYRQKHVRSSEPADWDGEWYYHLRPFSVVEWVDIDPIDRSKYPASDRGEAIEEALRAIHVPFSGEDGAIRIWGYVRPGVSPNWAHPPLQQ
jgi:hypothetical protein